MKMARIILLNNCSLVGIQHQNRSAALACKGKVEPVLASYKVAIMGFLSPQSNPQITNE